LPFRWISLSAYIFKIGFFASLIVRLTLFRANLTAMSSSLSFPSADVHRVCVKNRWVLCFNPSLAVLRSCSGLFSCQTGFSDFHFLARKRASRFIGTIHLVVLPSRLISIFRILAALIGSTINFNIVDNSEFGQSPYSNNKLDLLALMAQRKSAVCLPFYYTHEP
jgi:hypothetical protein